MLLGALTMVSCKKEERKDLNAPLINIQKKVAPEVATSDIALELDSLPNTTDTSQGEGGEI